ncbi:MgtC/SapB family protein [Stella sp.]|uniref:MgtC/SapB family protein n=1 Tax=Stella sp. TaxID=2912054 RepID=UPI0035B19F19
MPDTAIDHLPDLAVALGIGLLVGLERGWTHREGGAGGRVAGWRTFGLIGLAGGVLALTGGADGVLLPVGLFAVALFLGLGYWREARTEGGLGVTTEVAAVVTFGLGALAGSGQPAVAASAAIVVTLLLGFKPEMHGLLQRIERRELLATLRLLLISVVFLSLLPDRGFGPWEAINPHGIWRMVVLIAGIGYVGHFAIRMIGPRAGLTLTALLGALVSSTAVTLELSRRARGEAAQRPMLAAAIGLASAVMLVRLLVVVGVVAPAVLPRLAPSLVAAALLGAAASAWGLRRAGAPEADAPAERGDPLDLGGAIVMGGIFAAAAFLVQAVQHLIGNAGLYPLAALSGLFDVDAISISLAGGAGSGSIPAAVAADAILIAAVVNTLMKPAIAGSAGGPGFARALTLPIGASLVGGIAGWIAARPLLDWLTG